MRSGAVLLFFSSDYVFDGKSGPYNSAQPRPINVYGSQKLEAERVVLNASDRNVVIRTCQVYGPDPRRANFVLRTSDELREGRVVRVRDDLFGTPTYAPDLARETMRLLAKGNGGLWHVAGEDFVSRYQLAVSLCRAFGFNSSLITATSSTTATDVAPRPLRSGLIRSRRVSTEVATMETPLSEGLAALASMEVAL